MFEMIEKYNFWQNEDIQTGFFRSEYVDKILPYLGNKLIKVFLGQRRVGKSYLLRTIIKYLIQSSSVKAKNILYINMDIAQLGFISNAQILQQVIDQYFQSVKPRGKVYIFLDEVQEIINWEKAVNSLSQDYKQEFEVFISGSNANLLSSELSTFLGGRYVTFEIFPFSYSDYLAYHNMDRNKDTLITYFKNGGMPETLSLPDKEIRNNYISNLRDSVVLRDVVQRHKVRDVYLLRKIIDFVTDSVGSLFSVNKVTNYLKSSGHKTNNETVGHYLLYLKESYFIHEVDRFDLKGKQILSTEKKYYLNDLSFKYFLSSSFDFGIGNYLKNALYLDLRRKGCQIYVGRIGDKEIDFIAEKDGMRTYIQVAYMLTDDSVIEREFGNLELIGDNYKKYVVTFDDIKLGNRKGIEHMQAWHFIQ